MKKKFDMNSANELAKPNVGTPKARKPKHSQAAKPRGWTVRRGDTRSPIGGGDAEIDIDVVPPTGPRKTVGLKPSDLRKPKLAADVILNATGCTIRSGELEAKVGKLVDSPPRRMIFTTCRSGPVHGLFVTPAGVFRLVDDAPKTVVFDSGRARLNQALRAVGAKEGDLMGWRRQVAPVVAYSSIGMTVVAAALAAPLLEASGLSEGFLLNIAGPSTGGKSTLTLAAMSVQGKAVRACMVPPGLTERALEEVGQGFNHLLLPIDDLSKVTEAAKVRATCRWLTYQFSDGGGRLVSESAMRQGLSFERFLSIGLLSYERGSEEIAQLAGEVRQKGELARMFDLRADSVEGVFDQVPESETRLPEELAKHLESVVKTQYGAPLRALLAWVRKQDQMALGKRLRSLIARFVELVATGGDSVQRRAADKFGLMYAALVVGRDAGIIRWSEKRFRRALAKTYRSAISDATHVAPSAELVERLRLTLNLPGRTLQAKASGKVEAGLKGAWLVVTGLSYKGVPAVGLRQAALRSCFPNAVEYDRLVAELSATGWLTQERGKKRWQPRLNQGDIQLKPRLMRVSVQLLG